MKNRIDRIIVAVIIAVMVFLTYQICRGAELENTLWRYQLVQYPEVVQNYGFYKDDVYLCLENDCYQFPNTLVAWAFYNENTNIAIMYNCYMGSCGCIISYFNKGKAIQMNISLLGPPLIWTYDLTYIGELF